MFSKDAFGYFLTSVEGYCMNLSIIMLVFLNHFGFVVGGLNFMPLGGAAVGAEMRVAKQRNIVFYPEM